ncbi:MAG: hypothetical protein ACI39R_06975 [Lachnospiraceae bacterium]
MKTLFFATIYRMRKTTGVKVALVLTCLAAIGYYLLANMLASGSLAASQAGNVTALGDGMIIWLFGSLSVGLLVGNDFENKTVHGAIGYGRKRIVINYFLVFAVLVLLMVLPYTLGSLICIISGRSFAGAEGAVISNYLGNVIYFDDNDPISKLVLSYVAAAFVYMSQMSICIPVAVRLKKTVIVTAFGFFFGMITALLSTLASKVKILDNIYRLTPYHYGINKTGIGADVSHMLSAVLVSVIFIFLMGLLTFVIFRKSDIK